MDRKFINYLAAVAVLGLVIFCVTLWQPERQVRLHQAHFLKSVEDRSWPRFAGFIASDYSDRWGHDKSFVTKESSEVFRNFIWLTVKQEDVAVRMNRDAAEVSAKIVIAGSGTPIAEAVKQRVNSLTEPFTFTWKKRNWKPWNWQLSIVEQAELEIPEF